MNVMVLGLRGFPGIQGGVETHAEKLYPRLRDLGCSVDVIVRSPYWSKERGKTRDGMRFSPIWSPRSTGAEAFVHSFLGVLYAGLKRPDVLHIHAIGPSLFAPLAKLLGLRVVVTHHGPDYDREKWSSAAKAILRLGERLGVEYSDERIVISTVIGDLVRSKYRRGSSCIPNGVDIPAPTAPGETLRSLELTPRKYVLTVTRMVPEKRHLDLIEAFGQARLDGWKLVLVGDMSANDAYMQRVTRAAAQNEHVILAGFRTGTALAEIYENAGIFVLPSTHEGLPIALLEALSHGLPSIASDIPANLEVGLAEDQYFRVGDTAHLADRLTHIASRELPADYRSALQDWIRARYDWSSIARCTLGVYKRASQNTLGNRIRMAWMPE